MLIICIDYYCRNFFIEQWINYCKAFANEYSSERVGSRKLVKQMIQTLASTLALNCPNYDDIKTPWKGRESAIAIFDIHLIKLMFMKVFAQM